MTPPDEEEGKTMNETMQTLHGTDLTQLVHAAYAGLGIVAVVICGLFRWVKG